MFAKKNLILPLCISVAVHLAILSLTGFVNMRAEESMDNVLTVDLKKSPEKHSARREEKKGLTTLARLRIRGTPVSPEHNVYDADTVDLGDPDSLYAAYLKQLRRKIEKLWMYPEGAYAKKEEGVTVVRFSVSRSGTLGDINLLTSSGSALLDEGTFGVIKAAAPYDPLPTNFNLSRLNIVAAFRYRLVE